MPQTLDQYWSRFVYIENSADLELDKSTFDGLPAGPCR